MHSKLRDNLGSAMLALVLALIVWVNAVYQNDRPYEDYFPEQIPIEILNAPSGLAATNDPATSVRVQVRAFSSRWAALTTADFSATMDWSGLVEGMNTVPVQVTCADPTVTILGVQPQAVYVRLERIRRVTEDITVELQDRNEMPLGYTIGDPVVTPSTVTVEGPASTVDRVTQVQLPLSVLNQRAGFERDVALVALDESGAEVTGVTISPATAHVQLDIVKSENYREVAIRARTTGQPARGYFVSGVNVVPATVTLVGTADVIEAMGSLVDTATEIDVTGATRMLAERMELDIPSGVSVLGATEGETYTVLVTVSIDAVTGGSTVELPIQTRKLQEGLTAKLSVEQVDVILTGPAVVLDELETDLIEAYVDLSGLGPGTHQVPPQIDLNVTQTGSLSDLIVKDIQPKYIEVTITEMATPTPEPTPTLVPTITPRPTVTPTPSRTRTAETSN